MVIDKEFAKEIVKAANGDGSREARFVFLRPAKQAAKALSTPKAPYIFNDVVKEYGRVAVGVCVAVTILWRRDRLLSSSVQWALEVMKLWTNRPSSTSCVLIDDNLHPTRIEEYAGEFMKLTTEERRSL